MRFPVHGFQALALIAAVAGCRTNSPQSQPPSPTYRIDLGQAHRAADQAISAMSEVLGENAEPEVISCQELCVPDHVECDTAPAAMCRVKVWVHVSSLRIEEILVTLDFFIFVDGESMEVTGNFLSDCNADLRNCHVQIPAEEARLRVRNACELDQGALLASLTWDKHTKRVVWIVHSPDGSQLGTIWATGDQDPSCAPEFPGIQD